MLQFNVECVLLDIEGTTSAISFVHETLFPYARAGAEGFLRGHWTEGGVRGAREQMARDAGRDSFAAWVGEGGDFSEGALRVVLAEMGRLMDGDVKATGLKQLQGMIWEEGYARGVLRSHLFADVGPCLRAWHEAGIGIRIYSSGSVAAQRTFFGHTVEGDLTPLLSGFYDTTTGGKREVESYRKIAADCRAERILFLSDVAQELDAARESGMKTVQTVRPGNAPILPPLRHPQIGSLAELALEKIG